MRIVAFVLSTVLTIGLVWLLNTSLTVGGNKTPRFGAFLSPEHGFWKNAEPANITFNNNIASDKLAGKVEVYFDERLVPHVYAEKESDAYFVQGYLHAKFRLWQMEFQTHAAAGRLCEVLGDKKLILDKDKYFRRLGMLSAARQTLKEVESNPVTKQQLDSYTSGVNSYIETLSPKELPLEYKLLDYKPEKWTNLKTQLFLKYMSYQLAGFDADFEMTNARSIFSQADIEQLYPIRQDSLEPIIPKGTVFTKPGIPLKTPSSADTAYFNPTKTSAISVEQPDKNNGSNNWAVAGSKTKSGAAILCNDPHLNLSVPSLWYEMQICTPNFNAYGASLPGAPSIIIGFNENCAWGVTNASRDVKDYFEISFRDSSMKEYLFNGTWKKTTFRFEVIKVKGKADITEKIAITALGPVMYDKSYPNILKDGKYYAVRWAAHDSSNELLALNKLNHARNYSDFVSAISTYGCPGQNFVFASKSGDIAMVQQGKFPAKWQRQGDFVMPGKDSSYAWQGYIPVSENPSMYNPDRGFVSSANQLAADKNYPYYLPGRSAIYRGITINRMLGQMSQITVPDMQKMQLDNFDSFAAQARPLLLKYLNQNKLTSDEKNYVTALKTWNLRNDHNETGPTILDKWWRNLKNDVFDDEFSRTKLPVKLPDNSTLLEGLLRDSTFKFVDNINTPEKESLRTIVSGSFKKTCTDLDTARREGYLPWGIYKDSGVKHILSIPAFSRESLKIGGGGNSINATTKTVGPGWRMIVELTKEVQAYGVYAGGQSGNPGSKHYDDFIDSWANGKYFKLVFLNQKQAQTSKQFKWKMNFNKSDF